MRVSSHKTFNKQLSKLTQKRKIRVTTAIAVLLDDPSNTLLRRHALTGEWIGFFSISAGGDLRIHYEQLSDEIYLVAVGTHSQLYK